MATHAADKNDAHDPRMNYIPLGVDARGYHYVAQTATATVHAISPDGARERWDCDPERLDEFLDDVDDEYGLVRNEYDLSLGDILLRGLDV